MQVAGAGGVPASGAAGVVLNLTITQPSASTFVTAWPTGEQRPLAASLNAAPGQTFANLVVAKLGDAGQVSFYNRFGTSHLVADVMGWIPVGADLTTLTPSRILDTRSGTGVSGPGPVGPDSTIDLAVTVGGVPDDAESVIINITATQSTAKSFVVAWPSGVDRPLAASLNARPGASVPNLVIAKVGDGGRISLYNRFGTTHLVGDIVGYTTAGSTLVALAPSRLLDTRDGTGVAEGAVGPDSAIELDVTGIGDVPETGVTGVFLNVTATESTTRSFVTSYPKGIPRPLAASLNTAAGQTIPNLVLAPVGAGGKIRLYNRFGSAHLVADVVAYLTPPDGITAPVVADETLTVEPGHVLDIAGDPDADPTVTIRFAPDAEVEIGSIVVSPPTPGAPSGFLRRITAISVGPDGVLIAEAERATLTDAVPIGSFEAAAPLSEGTGRFVEASPIGTTAYNQGIECGAAVKLTTGVDGSLDPSISVNFDWDLDGLHKAQITAGLDVTLNLQAAATAEVTCSASTQVFVTVFTPITVPIGGFPFVFVPELSLDLELKGGVEGSISGTAAYGVQITAGIVYDENTGIDTVAAVTPTATSDWTVDAKAFAGVTLTPALKLAAYGLGGPEVSIPFGVSVDVEPCRTPLWRLTSSIKAKIGVALSSWLGDIELAATEFTLNENVIAEGGDPIPGFPGCESSVEIDGYGVWTDSEVELDDGDTVLEHRSRSNFESYAPDNALGRPAGSYLDSWTTTDPDFVPPGPIPVGPFLVDDRSEGSSSSRTAENAAATTSSSAAISFVQTTDVWSASLHVSADANASSTGEFDADGDAEGRASVLFTLEGTRSMSIGSCVPAGVLFMVSAVGVGSIGADVSGGCIDDVSIGPGTYLALLRADAEHSTTGGVPQSYAQDITLTLSS